MQSIVNKMGELREGVNVKQPDVIALTETWTNSDISDDFLSLDGYKLMERKDRKDTDRGLCSMEGVGGRVASNNVHW